ncbi:MAG: hypothetical protein IKX45_07255 [Bacteroidales bacterium]|nr:hypothetical protein [Bacteroidales bacterium]
MKKFVIILIILLCSCEVRVGYRVENRSSVNPLACVLCLDYSNDAFVREGFPYSTGNTQAWFERKNQADWRKFLGDSVAVYIIDPSIINVRIIKLHRCNDWLTKDEAQQINDNPECILAKYYLSRDQFMSDYGKYKFFPPDETMRTTVRMYPSYEELVTKYSK